MSYASRRTAKRQEIITALVAYFDASGVEYTSGSVVINMVMDEAIRLCREPENVPFRLKPSIMARRTWDAVHARYMKSQV